MSLVSVYVIYKWNLWNSPITSTQQNCNQETRLSSSSEATTFLHTTRIPPGQCSAPNKLLRIASFTLQGVAPFLKTILWRILFSLSRDFSFLHFPHFPAFFYTGILVSLSVPRCLSTYTNICAVKAINLNVFYAITENFYFKFCSNMAKPLLYLFSSYQRTAHKCIIYAKLKQVVNHT